MLLSKLKNHLNFVLPAQKAQVYFLSFAIKQEQEWNSWQICPNSGSMVGAERCSSLELHFNHVGSQKAASTFCLPLLGKRSLKEVRYTRFREAKYWRIIFFSSAGLRNPELWEYEVNRVYHVWLHKEKKNNVCC